VNGLEGIEWDNVRETLMGDELERANINALDSCTGWKVV
jgi:hypothetical protein